MNNKRINNKKMNWKLAELALEAYNNGVPMPPGSPSRQELCLIIGSKNHNIFTDSINRIADTLDRIVVILFSCIPENKTPIQKK